MNNLKDVFKKSKAIQEFSKNYCAYLSRLLESLNHDVVATFIVEFNNVRESGKMVFFIGNGGSAATASHMANDFGANLHAKLPHLKPIRTISLTDNNAAMLAIANDLGYEELFVAQLKVLFSPGDILVAISASGNSPNVVKAARWVKEQGGKVFSLVGFDGGELAKVSDLVIHPVTEKGEYGPVEDVHMIMDHLMFTWMFHKGQERVSQDWADGGLDIKIKSK